MNAWIDCMTYLDEPEAGMSSIFVAKGEVLVLCIIGANDFKTKRSEIYNALVEGSAFVNYRRIEQGQQAILTLSFHK